MGNTVCCSKGRKKDTDDISDNELQALIKKN